MKVSKAQREFLRTLAADPHGYLSPPAGYRTAGPDAARWHTTARALERAGLVRVIRASAYGYIARLILPAPAFVYGDESLPPVLP